MANLITLDEIISAAFLRFDNQDSRDELVFQDWAWNALLEIGPSKLDTKTECIEVSDLCIEKPCGYISMINMNLLNSDGQVVYYQMQSNAPMKSENSRLNDSFSFYSQNSQNNIRCAETKDYFELSSNASDAGITQAEMSYYSFPVDDEGNPVFEEIMKEAVLSYIEHAYVRRQRHREREKIPLSEVQYFEDVWRRKRQEIRGAIKMPSINEFHNIAKQWVTAIPRMKSRARDFRGGYRKR